MNLFGRFAMAFGIGIALATSATAAGGGLPDGEYDCGGGYSFVHMGKMDVKGGQFRYRPLDKAAGGFAPYSVEGNGVIAWGGPFPGLEILGSQRESWGFNIKFRAGQLVNTMSCHAPGR